MYDWIKRNLIGVFLGAVLLIAAVGALTRGSGLLPAGALQFQSPAAVEVLEPEPEPAVVLPKAPEGAVTVRVGDTRLFTLESEEIAAAFLNGLLQSAYDGADITLHPGAKFLQEVALMMPEPGETVLPLAEAEALLTADPALIPIAVTTTWAEETPGEAYETETEKSALLPKGSRMIKQLGSTGQTVTLFSSTILSGEAQASTDTVAAHTLWETRAEELVTGRYSASRPEKEPGKTEGEKGPKDVELTLKRPVKASISSNFGTRLGAMHYGVDYACKAGAAVTAPVAGVVIYAAERGEYGFVLEIETENGCVVRLARLSDCTVKLGDAVEAEQALAVAAEASVENDKPRVHMEVLIGGVAYNPRQYLD